VKAFQMTNTTSKEKLKMMNKEKRGLEAFNGNNEARMTKRSGRRGLGLVVSG
jgi:hypothetical protein